MHRPVGMYPTAFGKPPPPSELGPLNNLIFRGPHVPVVQDMQVAYLDGIVSTCACSVLRRMPSFYMASNFLSLYRNNGLY